MDEVRERLEKLSAKYNTILEEEKQLKRKKEDVRSAIVALLAEMKSDKVKLADSTSFTVKHKVDTVYDEEALQHQLEARYIYTLAPDMKKIKANLEMLMPMLKEYMQVIGSPSQERIEESIEDGLLDAKEIEGSYVTKEKDVLYAYHPKVINSDKSD